ncbi:GNAT family N-acetyltransferase [Streptomyces luteolus]|uniref:GNAT family N-acetyltransferase n=1 Tax=Streptomyces luteolus TaxID=3043615 RepID=A0ABT6T5I4_9ACTN|nr:GNAT family N-acetyltransferase [Streptomyces sp. B-S-A12]MDI3422900.1 GNAT family N-acetyltransferase [Streptomyces sp. B-S-A12]
MDLKLYTHADAKDVRTMLLDIHDEAYADDSDPFHSRARFSYFLDLWSKREDWLCISGWENGCPVGYAYGSKFKPGGWWLGSTRPRHVRGPIFALSELMVVPKWRGTGRARQIHDALLAEVEGARSVSLQVEARHPKVQALYVQWGYEKVGESEPSPDAPLYAVMAKPLHR